MLHLTHKNNFNDLFKILLQSQTNFLQNVLLNAFVNYFHSILQCAILLMTLSQLKCQRIYSYYYKAFTSLV